MAYILKSDVRADKQQKLATLKTIADIGMSMQKMKIAQQEAQKESGMGGVKQLLQIAQLENLGIVPPGTSKAIAPSALFGNASSAPQQMPTGTAQPVQPGQLNPQQLQQQQAMLAQRQAQQPGVAVPQVVGASQVAPVQTPQNQNEAEMIKQQFALVDKMGLGPKDTMDTKQAILQKIIQNRGDVQSKVTEEEVMRNPKLQTLEKQKEIENKAAAKKTEEGVAAREAGEIASATKRLAASSFNVTNSFLDYAVDLYKSTGVRPGTIGGVVSKFSPNEILKMKEQFMGAQMENAAQVAATSIPGARAVRIIGIFTKDAPSTFSTVESGISNSSRSLMGAIIKDAVENPEEYGIDANLPTFEQIKKAEEVANKIGKQYTDNFLLKFYKAEPELFSDNEVKEYAKELYERNEKIENEFNEADFLLLGS